MRVDAAYPPHAMASMGVAMGGGLSPHANIGLAGGDYISANALARPRPASEAGDWVQADWRDWRRGGSETMGTALHLPAWCLQRLWPLHLR